MEHPTLTPAVGYLRVSRPENKGDLAIQRKKCERYANDRGYQIIKFFTDKVSGYADMLSKSELTKLICRCKTDSISHIITSDLSRLTRRLRDGILLLDWLHRYGISLHLCNLNITQAKADYLSLVTLLVNAERTYNRGLTKLTESPKVKSRTMGKPPTGYSHSKQFPGRLEKVACNFNIESLFSQAIEMKRTLPAKSLRDIARLLGNKDMYPNARSIANILTTPLYTGRDAPRGGNKLSSLTKYPKHHDAYVEDEGFAFLNDYITKRRLYYTEVISCEDCCRKVSFRKNELYCPNCGKSLSLSLFHCMMLELCRKYIYDPDETLEFQFSNMWSITQMEALLGNIITLGTTANNTHTFVPPEEAIVGLNDARERIGVEWQHLKKEIKSLQLCSYDLVLHYRMRMELNDEGKGLRAFIEASFGKVIVKFGGKNQSTVEPMELKPGIIVSNNPIKDRAYKEDMANLDKTIKRRIQLIRELLHANPFLSDFLAYNIIDDRFRQWEDAPNFIEEFIRLNPFM